MKRIFAILFAMLFASALFGGCGGETTGTPGRTLRADTATEATTKPQASGELGPLTKDIFAIYTKGGTYHVKYVGPMAGGGLTTDEVYAKGGNLAMMAPGEEYNRIVIKDGWYYQVSDGRKAVIKTPLADIAGYPIPPDTASMNYVGSGKADFMGEELDYDEYSHADGFHAFYFVKDDKLKGIRHAGDNFADVNVEYLIFEKEVPDSVFDVPANYPIVTEATSRQPTEPLVLSSNQSTTDATRNPTPEKTHTSVGQVQSTNQGGGASSPVTYNPIRGDWPEYKNASEVVEKADLVFEGKVTGISFQVLDARTSLPPTSDTEEWNRSLHTVYDVEIISTYKGSAQGRIQVKMDGGIRGVRVDEQLKVLGADASKGIPVVEGMPVLAIGKTYLFVVKKNGTFPASILNTNQSVYDLANSSAKQSNISANDVIAIFE